MSTDSEFDTNTLPKDVLKRNVTKKKRYIFVHNGYSSNKTSEHEYCI